MTEGARFWEALLDDDSNKQKYPVSAQIKTATINYELLD